jgi:hypothetical protein
MVKQVVQEAVWRSPAGDFRDGPDQFHMFASGDIPTSYHATNNADYTTYVGLFEKFDPLISRRQTQPVRLLAAQPEARTWRPWQTEGCMGTPKYQRFGRPWLLHVHQQDMAGHSGPGRSHHWG